MSLRNLALWNAVLTRWGNLVCFPVGMGYILQRTSGFSTNEPRFLPWGVTYAGMTKYVAIWSLGTEGLWRRPGLLQVALETIFWKFLSLACRFILVIGVCALPDPSPALACLEKIMFYVHLPSTQSPKGSAHPWVYRQNTSTKIPH